MSVRKTGKSPYWQYEIEFTLDGQRHRFGGTTKCTVRRDAETVEAEIKASRFAELKAAKTAQAALPLGEAIRKYWEEVGQHHAGAGNTKRDLFRLGEYFGVDKSLHAITDQDVTNLVGWRREHRVRRDPRARLKDCPPISAATVNRSTTEVLKKLFTRAKQNWGVRFEREPVWKNHWLKEPKERVRELHEGEASRIAGVMRDDYAPFFEFIHATGLRWHVEAMTLRWSEVDWGTRRIVKAGKGGEGVAVPITGRVREILWPLQGHHGEFVFTYVAQRTRPAEGLIKGCRYPLTTQGVKTRWRRMRKQAGVTGFRLHDFRHDFGTKLLRETGNLKLVSRAMNHASVLTTAKYAHVADGEVAAALEARDAKQNRAKNPGKNPGNLLGMPPKAL
jgi:integrase